jgi:hypothetical protein
MDTSAAVVYGLQSFFVANMTARSGANGDKGGLANDFKEMSVQRPDKEHKCPRTE